MLTNIFRITLTVCLFLISCGGGGHGDGSSDISDYSGIYRYELYKTASQGGGVCDGIGNNGIKGTLNISQNGKDVTIVFNDVTYNFKETISFVNESLEKSSYTLLYNLEEANDPSIKAKNDHHDDDEEDEKGHHGNQSHENNSENCTKMDEETKIFGIAMISDEVFYEFVSESEIEEHNNKKEFERTFKIFVGEKDYILVEEENEVKNNKTESSFEYTVVENGAKVLNYSISIENKNNKDVIEYEIDDVEYEIKRTMNESGEEIYKIEVENEHDYEFVVCYKKVTNEDGSISFVSM